MSLRSFLLLAAMVLFGPSAIRAGDQPTKRGPNSAEEPMAEGFSIERGARFLDAVSVDWTRQRKCGTCHTNYAHMMARPMVKGPQSPELAEVRAFFEGRVAGWDRPDECHRSVPRHSSSKSESDGSCFFEPVDRIGRDGSMISQQNAPAR
jgi:squalene-hopene/tetraprenyl-beta-curcumene cyclase